MPRAPSNRVSPSQIGEWRDGCQRRWWYDRNRKCAQNTYAEFGDRTHLHLEGWLEHGAPPPIELPPEHPDHAPAHCAVAGLEHLPPPGTALVEQRFRMEHGGVVYSGRIDFLYGYDPGRVIVVGDHKTCGNLRYAKTPEQLLDDPQRIVYTRWACVTFGVETGVAQWVYYRRKRPKAKPVIFAEHRDAVERRFEHLHRTAGLPIIAAKHLPTPDRLPRNLSRCKLYPPEGCPHQRECLADVPPAEIAIAALTETKR